LHKDAAALLIFGGDEPDQDSLDEEDRAGVSQQFLTVLESG
jgi:hypothetical protein